MKKLIPLILVVFLCLSSVSVGVLASGADTYTITAASGADKTSNDYLNIYKYLAYYDGGDTLLIPENYITVGQWKENIQNPTINGNGVVDTDYITSDCILTLTMDDGVTTKYVEIEVVSYNEIYKKYDKKPTTTYDSNNFGLTYSKGSKATVTVGNKIVSGSDYGLTMDVEVPSEATNSQGYINVIQKLDAVNSLTTPYIIDMNFKLESVDSLYKLSVGFMDSKGSGRALTDLPSSVVNAFKSSDNVSISMVVFPKAAVMDIYVDGSLIIENKNMNDTNNNTTYANYNRLLVRLYNGTKVSGEYKNLTFTITDYEIRNGYGNVNAPIYIKPEIDISNYTDGAKITSEDIIALEAVTNSDDMKKARLYIDGTKVDEATVIDKVVALDMSSMGYGDHSVEVRLYPEIGEYISKSITISVTDYVNVDDYTITFDEFDIGETPASIDKPVESLGDITFINYSNESLEDSFVIAKDAYVEYYDNVRGNVFHAKADLASNTEKTGRRIEIMQTNTANNMAVNFDMMFESFSGTEFSFLETRGTGVNYAASIGKNGLLKMYGTTTSDTTSIQLETGVWYNFNAEFYCTKGGVVKLNVYDENGSLVGSMESLNGASYTDRVRIYTPYNNSNPQLGEAYIDNVKTTIVSITGSISEITATDDDLNTVNVLLNGVATLYGVELVGANGTVEISNYSFNVDDVRLTVSTAQPLDAYGSYTIKVYADGYIVPITLGFSIATECVKVLDMYLDNLRNKDYVVLDVSNNSTSTGSIIVLISKWNGNSLASVESKTITVDAGEKEYRVQYTNNEGYALKVMPIKSFAKPVLVSESILIK